MLLNKNINNFLDGLENNYAMADLDPEGIIIRTGVAHTGDTDETQDEMDEENDWTKWPTDKPMNNYGWTKMESPSEEENDATVPRMTGEMKWP